MITSEYGVPDEENPEWTREMFASARRLHELPEPLQSKLRALDQARIAREAERANKVPVSFQIPKDIADRLSTLGPDLDARLEEHLREWLAEQLQAAA